MNNIINIITKEFYLGLLAIIIMVVIVGIGIHLLKSLKKLKWNYSTTLLVISVLLGLTLTQLGEAIVKESPSEKESRTKTEKQDKDKNNTEKTDVTPKSDEIKKADTQKNET